MHAMQRWSFAGLAAVVLAAAGPARADTDRAESWGGSDDRVAADLARMGAGDHAAAECVQCPQPDAAVATQAPRAMVAKTDEDRGRAAAAYDAAELERGNTGGRG